MALTVNEPLAVEPLEVKLVAEFAIPATLASGPRTRTGFASMGSALPAIKRRDRHRLAGHVDDVRCRQIECQRQLRGPP